MDLVTSCFRLLPGSLVIPASAQVFESVPGVLTQVVAGRAEVWGINSPHKVYRYNAPNAKFVQVAGTLTHVAVGGGSLLQSDAVWGISSSVSGVLTQITVGDSYTDNCHPYEVLGLNGGGVYRYNYCTAVFDNIPFSGSMTRISTGGGDVWGLNSAADIFQYNFQTQQWIQIGGTLQQIPVGVNDVWGLDGSGKACRYDHSPASCWLTDLPCSFKSRPAEMASGASIPLVLSSRLSGPLAETDKKRGL